MLRHLQDSGHRLCTCGGYHYAHRPYGGYCYRHEMAIFRDAERRGYDCDPAEIAWETPGRVGGTHPPF